MIKRGNVKWAMKGERLVRFNVPSLASNSVSKASAQLEKALPARAIKKDLKATDIPAT
jgi:hypothetical protein